MKVRAAEDEDAPAMGRVMVDSFLSAHQGQMPDAAWQKRLDEWTPDVSARGWAGAIAEQGCGEPTRGVVLVAEDNAGVLCALVSGAAASDDPSGSTAEIGALYVLPDRRGQGIGGCLLRAAASELATLDFSELQIGVLTANLAARGFYEAMGGHEVGQRTFDEEGFLLPVTIYGWPDIAALGGDSSRTSWRSPATGMSDDDLPEGER